MCMPFFTCEYVILKCVCVCVFEMCLRCVCIPLCVYLRCVCVYELRLVTPVVSVWEKTQRADQVMRRLTGR